MSSLAVASTEAAVDHTSDRAPPIAGSGTALPSVGGDRRYDLDWLRIFAFGVLILYHVGMFYVTWDWYLKSRYSSAFLEPIMGLTAGRLALLFFISGAALRLAMDRRAVGSFLSDRITRLLVLSRLAWS